MERRLERLCLGVVDRCLRESHQATWRTVSRTVEIFTETPPRTERQLERAHQFLLEFERAIGYEHPTDRVVRRRPRLHRAEEKQADINSRIDRRGPTGNLATLYAELGRAQATVAELHGKSAAISANEMTPQDLRALALDIESEALAQDIEDRFAGVRRYTLSSAELEAKFPSARRTQRPT